MRATTNNNNLEVQPSQSYAGISNKVLRRKESIKINMSSTSKESRIMETDQLSDCSNDYENCQNEDMVPNNAKKRNAGTEKISQFEQETFKKRKKNKKQKPNKNYAVSDSEVSLSIDFEIKFKVYQEFKKFY